MSCEESRAVCFDLDHTVLSLTESYASVVHAVAERHLGERDESFEVAYSDRFLELLGDLEPEPYRRAFADALADTDHDATAVDAPAMASSLREAEIDALEPSPGIETAMATLQDEGVAVGVVTNGVPEFQREKVAAFDLDSYVDGFVTSYEAGAHKPDPRPFELAAERLGADAYVMVGDSYEADVAGARDRGWRGVHYAPDGDSPADDPLRDFHGLLDRVQ